MPRKSQPVIDPEAPEEQESRPAQAQSEIGAAAALRRLEQREFEESQEIERLCKVIKDERALLLKRPDDKDITMRLRVADIDLVSATERHGVIVRNLLNYEKNISQDKREGITHPQSKIELWLEMFVRYQRLALEKSLLAFSQDATTCGSAMEIYKLGENIWRDTLGEMFETAVKEQKLPLWARSAAEKGL